MTKKLKNCWAKPSAFGMRMFQKWKSIRNKVRNFQREGGSYAVRPMQEAPVTHCQNCGADFQGNYCPSCGQKYDVKRLTVKDVLSNLVVSLLGGDSVFLRSCLHLLCRPGFMVRDFLLGCRTRYFRPVQMLLCLVTVYAVASFTFGIPMASFELSDSSEILQNIHSELLLKSIDFICNMLSNKVVVSLFSAFVCMLPYTLVFHRCRIIRSDGSELALNKAEQFCTQIYLACQSLLVSIINLPVRKWTHWDLMSGFSETLFSFVLSAWAYRQLLGLRWYKSLLLTFVANLIMIISILVLVLLSFGLFYGFDSVMQ